MMSAAPNTAARSADLCAFFGIERVGIAGSVPGTRFDYNFQPGLGEIGNHHGDQGHAALARVTFFWNSNNHAALILSIQKQ